MKCLTFCITVLFVLTAQVFSGCSTALPNIAVSKAIEEGKIKVGMSLDELVAVIGRPPNMFDEVRQMNDSSGETFVWMTKGANVYTFTFKNRVLVTYVKRRP